MKTKIKTLHLDMSLSNYRKSKITNLKSSQSKKHFTTYAGTEIRIKSSKKYILFSRKHKIVTKINLILSHKPYVNVFIGMKIIPQWKSDFNEINLGIYKDISLEIPKIQED